MHLSSGVREAKRVSENSGRKRKKEKVLHCLSRLSSSSLCHEAIAIKERGGFCLLHFCFFHFIFPFPSFPRLPKRSPLSLSPMFRIISRVRKSFLRRRRADSDSGAVTQEERGAEERREKNRDSSTSGRSAGEEASLSIRSEIVILGQSSSPSPSPGPHCAGSVKRVFLLRSKEEKNPPAPLSKELPCLFCLLPSWKGQKSLLTVRPFLAGACV